MDYGARHCRMAELGSGEFLTIPYFPIHLEQLNLLYYAMQFEGYGIPPEKRLG